MNFFLKYLKRYTDKKELEKSNFGRDYEWYIEYEGEIVGKLIDYECTDMFWCSYTIVPIHNGLKNIVFNEDLWQDCKFKFKNKKYNKYAEHAFSGYTPGSLTVTQTIRMRGLYVTKL